MKFLASVITLAAASPLAAQSAPALHTSHDQSIHAMHPGQHGPGHGDHNGPGGDDSRKGHTQHQMEGGCCDRAPDGKMACCEKMKAAGKKPCCENKQSKPEAQGHKH